MITIQISLKMPFSNAAYIVLLTADRAMNVTEISDTFSKFQLWEGKGIPKEKNPNRMLEKAAEDVDNYIRRVNKTGNFITS